MSHRILAWSLHQMWYTHSCTLCQLLDCEVWFKLYMPESYTLLLCAGLSQGIPCKACILDPASIALVLLSSCSCEYLLLCSRDQCLCPVFQSNLFWPLVYDWLKRIMPTQHTGNHIKCHPQFPHEVATQHQALKSRYIPSLVNNCSSTACTALCSGASLKCHNALLEIHSSSIFQYLYFNQYTLVILHQIQITHNIR